MTLTYQWQKKKDLEIVKRSPLIKTRSQTLKNNSKNSTSTPNKVSQKKEEITDKDIVDKKKVTSSTSH